MPKVTAAVLAVLVVLTLTGCAGTPESGANEPEQASETAAPLVAETPAEEAVSDVDAAFVEDVRRALSNGRETSIPDATDAQLLTAGYEACEQLANGVSEAEVHVVEDEQPDDMYGQYPESFIIAGVATGRIC